MSCVGFIGAGNMARAMGGGIAAGKPGTRILATDPDPAARDRFAQETGGSVATNLDEVVGAADVLVLAVKPQVLASVLDKLAGRVRAEQIVVSIAAGFTLKSLARKLGASCRLVRAMPNTPALVREGITVLVGGGAATADDIEAARDLFTSIGDAVVVDDESLLDAVTAVSGSGPGFVFAFAEAWLKAAESAGLAPALAERLVKQTLFGAATLWRASGDPPDKLRAMVTSPGGTTLAGLEALEARGFARAIGAAIDSAARRSKELSAG
ncbi:pyrroline-5-carboxylate reductase [Candidatus Binatia bacterium]|nr:pyrroline-5-carboxylate reductase [Candidatus Binatia bacterium]